ncbi:MAG: Maf family protein [Flavobacteriales bacterium]|nr:Maf family protein [Flavobacteriales bacterium]
MKTKRKVYLGSGSPRRKMLLEEMGIEFEQVSADVDEVFPDDLALEKVPVFLSELKAKAIFPLCENGVLITADTVVICDDVLLGKPKDFEDAFEMIKILSNNTHEVITGVTITDTNGLHSFSSKTQVTFHDLTDEEIEHYINSCEPYDKAGSYGIQEWMGYVGIKSMNGSFYNVMGLPTDKLFRKLKEIDII